MGFLGSPMSSVKRKMYFSTELGFVACVCYGNSAVAKFKVKSSVFYFFKQRLPTSSAYVLSLSMGLSWGCLSSFDETVCFQGFRTVQFLVNFFHHCIPMHKHVDVFLLSHVE